VPRRLCGASAKRHGIERKQPKLDVPRQTSYGALLQEAQKERVPMTRIASEAGLSRQGLYDLLAERP